VAAADADPMAPAVMGRDRDRLAALRAAAPASLLVTGTAAAADLALHRLTAAAGKATPPARGDDLGGREGDTTGRSG
jgi:hypothetical protein